MHLKDQCDLERYESQVRWLIDTKPPAEFWRLICETGYLVDSDVSEKICLISRKDALSNPRGLHIVQLITANIEHLLLSRLLEIAPSKVLELYEKFPKRRNLGFFAEILLKGMD